MPDQPSSPSLPVPTHFLATTEHKASPNPWWETALGQQWQAPLQHVLTHNPYISNAAAAVTQAQANLRQAKADLGLDTQATATGSISRSDGDDTPSISGALDMSLPLDLFDRLKLTRDASAYTLAEKLARLEQSRLEQIEAYLLAAVDAGEAKALASLLTTQLNTANTLLQLTELRFSQGLASSIDVLQQRAQLAALREQPPAVNLTLRLALNRMAELSGQTPSATQTVPDIPKVATLFATPSPRALLDKRPDLIAARAQLAAENSQYEALLRERLPDVALSAQTLLRVVAGNPSALLDIALSASAPLFDSGRLQANLDAGAAQLQAAGIDYLQTWLTALRQTEDLIARHHSLSRQLQLSTQTLAVNGQLFEAAQRRYRRGVSDYLPVLNALRGLQQQQRDHLALQAEQQRIAIRLHTAMGLPTSKETRHE